MKVYGIDYLNPSTQQLDFIVVDAEDEEEAFSKACDELKTLKIPKRYIIKMEELLWQKF